MELEKWAKLLQYLMWICGIITAISGLAYGIIDLRIKAKEKESSALSGEIKQRHSTLDLEAVRRPAEYDNGRPKETDEVLMDRIILRLGTNKIPMSKKEFENGTALPLNVAHINGVSPIKVKIENGKMLVSAKVFDISGKIVAEIENNEWTINPNNYFKRKYDDYALEVIDQYDITVLQVDYETAQFVSLAGVFQSAGGTVLIDNQGLKFGGFSSIDDLREASKHIDRIFDYGPGSALGERKKQ